MAEHELFVDREHIESLTKGSPTLAIAELLWNSWDAEAKNISVKIVRTDLHGIEKVIVTDDGRGMDGKDPKVLFTQIGGSWKAQAKRTETGRPIHGERGRGRLKALSIGNKISWKIPDARAGLIHSIILNATTINKIDLTTEPSKPESAGKSIVEIEDIGDRAGELLNREKVHNILATHFALSLKNYQDVSIKYDGKLLDPNILIESIDAIPIPLIHEGVAYNVELEIVHWKHKSERKLYICDGKGRILQEAEVKTKPGPNFQFCAYIKSDEFLETLGDSNDIIISGGICAKILDEARLKMKAYFREKKAQVASNLVKAWKDEGIYPYKDETSDPVETVKRQVFDICAYNIHEFLDGFSSADTQSRQLTFFMLSEAINEKPSALKKIFENILKMPKDRMEELADIFDQVDIGRAIEATQLAVGRLSFIDGLNNLIFDEENAKLLEEKHHLHGMLEKEPWIFGEEYTLAASEVTLTTLLRRHLPILRPEEKITPVLSTDGKSMRIDMLLGCEIGTGDKEYKEFLVVELKRPTVEIGQKERDQLEQYAFAVSEDPQFDKTKTKWTFLIVSKKLHPIIERFANQPSNPAGFWQAEPNFRVGAMTWGQILTKCRSRLQWYREALNFGLTKSQSMEYMQKKHNQFLPDKLKAEE